MLRARPGDPVTGRPAYAALEARRGGLEPDAGEKLTAKAPAADDVRADGMRGCADGSCKSDSVSVRRVDHADEVRASAVISSRGGTLAEDLISVSVSSERVPRGSCHWQVTVMPRLSMF